MEMIQQLQVPIIAENMFHYCILVKIKWLSNLGIRKTFADVGKTVADYFNIKNDLKGTSFLNE